jgi:hypothetical protein
MHPCSSFLHTLNYWLLRVVSRIGPLLALVQLSTLQNQFGSNESGDMVWYSYLTINAWYYSTSIRHFIGIRWLLYFGFRNSALVEIPEQG